MPQPGIRTNLETYLGQPIAILCARYWYRGIVHSLTDDTVTLKKPYCVEVTGPNNSIKPCTEDILSSDIHIAFDAIEVISQPTWAFYGYKTKDEYIKILEAYLKSLKSKP